MEDIPRGTKPIHRIDRVALTSPAGRTLVVGLVLGSSAAFLYTSVVDVALPAIGDDLDVGLTGLQWVVNGYLVAMATLILVGGSAGDVLGRDASTWRAAPCSSPAR